MSELQNKSNVVELLKTLANVYLEKGDYPAAIEKLEKALELGLDDRSTFQNLARAYIMLGKRDNNALQIYERALAYEPENHQICIALAESYAQTGREDEYAIEIYTRAFSYDHAHKEIFLKLFDIRYRNGELALAGELAMQAVAENAIMPDSLSHYLRIVWQQNDFVEGIEFLKRQLKKKLQGPLLIGFCKTLVRHQEWMAAQKRDFITDRDSCKYCAIFIKATRKINSLDDLLLYLDIERLLRQAVEHYDARDEELVKALKAAHSTPEEWLENDLAKDVLQKLEFGPGERIGVSGQDKKEKSERLLSEFVQSISSFKVLAVYAITNYAQLVRYFNKKIAKRITETFISNCSIQLEKLEQHYFWRGSDSVIVLTENLPVLLQASKNIFGKLEKYNKVVDQEEIVHAQVAIHEIDLANSAKAVNVLSATLRMSRLGQTGQKDQSEASERIFICGDIAGEIKADEKFEIHKLDDVDLLSKIQMSELLWRDPVQSLNLGDMKQIGRFEIIEQLGDKSMLTYKVRDARLERPAILKAVANNVATGIEWSQFEKLFLEQALLPGSLSHPNIAITFDVGKENGLLFVFREFVEGADLAEELKSSQSISFAKKIEILLQICKGIGYAHSRGIIHGNLKPSNIFLSESVKITDFGIPVVSQYVKRPQASMPETYAYQSPEHLQKKELIPESDVFSLGTLLFEFMTGEKPFMGETVEELDENILIHEPSIPSKLDDQLPELVDGIVLKALQKDPGKRYRNASQLEQELQKILLDEKQVA